MLLVDQIMFVYFNAIEGLIDWLSRDIFKIKTTLCITSINEITIKHKYEFQKYKVTFCCLNHRGSREQRK